MRMRSPSVVRRCSLYLYLPSLQHFANTHELESVSKLKVQFAGFLESNTFVYIYVRMDVWCVVEFDGEKSSAIIPKSWMIDDGKKAYWPSYKSFNKIENAIQRKEDPGASWQAFDISKILATAESYDEAKVKMNLSLNTSEVEEEYERMKDKSLRSTRHKKKMDFSTTSDENDEEQSNIKLNFDSFPSPPSHSKFKTISNADSEVPEESKSAKENLEGDSESVKAIAPLPTCVQQQSSPINNMTDKSNLSSGSRSPLSILNYKNKLFDSVSMDLSKYQTPPQDSKASSPRTTSQLDTIVNANSEVPQENGSIQGTPITQQSSCTNNMSDTSTLTAETRRVYLEKMFYNDSNTSKDQTPPQDPKPSISRSESQLENVHQKQQRPRPNIVIKSVETINLEKKIQLVNPPGCPTSKIDHHANCPPKKRSKMPLAAIDNLTQDNQHNFLIEMVGEVLQNQAEERAKLDVILSSRRSSCSSVTGLEEIDEMRSIFPIDTLQNFLQLHDLLKDDAEFESKVKLFLKTIGGRNPHMKLRNMLAEALTKEVAVQFNFVGTRGKRSFAKHRIWKTLLNLAVSPGNGYTKSDAEETTKLWLKAANKIKYKKGKKADKKINDQLTDHPDTDSE